MTSQQQGDPVRELVDFDRVILLMDFEPPNPSLIVSGLLPYPMDVHLEPADVAGPKPEYWPTEVVGYRAEITTPQEQPFSVQISLSRLSRGSKGIEVIGKSKAETVDIPGSS